MNLNSISTNYNTINLSTINNNSQLIQISSLQQKISQAKSLNDKLHKLFHSLKSNTHIKTLSHSNSSSLLSNKQKVQSRKQLQKLQMQVQHMKHLQNILLCESKKLKQEVNNRRKQRVIYSNIFKKYEKDIRKWQDTFKESLLDSMATEDAQYIIKDKLYKIKRKLQKEIKQLQIIKLQQQADKKMSLLGQQEKCNSKNNSFVNGKQPYSLKSKDMISSSKKNNMFGQSYKRLLSQKQLELKAKSLQSEFQKQSKKIMYQALGQQLMNIADCDNLHEAIDMLKSIDMKTQQIYKRYEQLQRQNKQKQNRGHELQELLKQRQGTSSFINTSKSIQDKSEQQLHNIQRMIKEQQQRMRKLQNELSIRLDVNCRKLSTQQLVPFIQRFIMTKQQDQKIINNNNINNMGKQQNNNMNKQQTNNVNNVNKQINNVNKQINNSNININMNNNIINKQSSILNQVNNYNQGIKLQNSNLLSVVGQRQKIPRKSRNQLDKKLHKIQKQKQIDHYLLTYNQISQSMLQHYRHHHHNNNNK